VIESVLVDYEGTVYECEPWAAGYLCGWCQAPLPKMPPEIGDECQCGAHVHGIIRSSSTRDVHK
jgi:hypothetical protein